MSKTFIIQDDPLCTRLGDWFGWALVVAHVGLVAISATGRKRDGSACDPD